MAVDPPKSNLGKNHLLVKGREKKGDEAFVLLLPFK